MSNEQTIEQRARDLGWHPQEEWKGVPEKWVDAEAFVEKGESILPILRQNNKKLHREIQDLRDTNAKQAELLNANSEAIEELKNFNTSINKDKVSEIRKGLVKELAAARAAEDTEKEVEIQDQLDANREAMREAKETPVLKPEKGKESKPDNSMDPAQKAIMDAWTQANDWYGADIPKTALANGIAEKLKREGTPLRNREFLDKVAEEVETYLGGNPNRQNNRVEGNRNSGDNQGKKGETYSDLPADAKEACARQGKRLIGPGRAYKDEGEWQKAYTKEYFKE